MKMISGVKLQFFPLNLLIKNTSKNVYKIYLFQNIHMLAVFFINKHSESIASNTKSSTSGIFNQDSSSRTKLNFDF
jgi:hypothetical protein